MINYKRINDLVGWAVFLFALIVYWASMSPTASFWDCGEFISCANELQVPHPPGPPIYLLLGRAFAMFAGDVTQIAYMVNLLSVFSGAFTILFTFWTITMLAKKVAAPDDKEPASDKTALIMFAGLVGALACTFTDSFWFNAVEAEVYAMSSLCTAAVVWLIFKWEARADQPGHLRWIILIAFVVGLSIGVHLLNLLAIPAIAVVYFFRKYEFSWLGLFVTLGASVIILGAIMIGVIQYSMEIIWVLEQVFVGYETMDPGGFKTTGMGMGIGTGVYVFMILFALIIGAALYFTAKPGSAKVGLYGIDFEWSNATSQALLLSLVYVMIGYSTYIVIGMRANTAVPINENAPGDVTSMLSYMKREQYGDRPLMYGPLYPDVQNGEQKKDRKNFVKLSEENWYVLPEGDYTLLDGQKLAINEDGKLKTSGVKWTKNSALSDSSRVRYNRNANAVQVWKVSDRYVWDGHKMKIEYPARVKKFFPRMYSQGHYEYPQHLFGYRRFVEDVPNPKDPKSDKPTPREDMKFFFSYQINHMYLRYFGWNFIGREGDKQDDGVESGLEVWRTKEMPAVLENDPGKNHYFALPLLLGLFGMIWHFFSRTKDASAIGLLFFFTGLAIIIYLNQTPSQPRERDYSYAGSFQTFCIWIGLGVVGLHELLQPYLKKITPWVVGSLSLLLVPVIMGAENWDDHTRHQRYIAPDSAYNLLNSCEKDGILFTNGDNDTFPLWYIQEVEGVRTDVRVVNLSLLNTDWYIDQMRKQSNASPPLPITLRQMDYYGDKNAFRTWDKSKKNVKIPVDPEAVLANGTVKPDQANDIIAPMPWKVRTRGGSRNPYLLKQDYMIFDIIMTNAQNGWERPIYFSSTIPPSSYMNLTDYFQVEGLAYRVVPVKLDKRFDPYPNGVIDAEKTYKKLTEEFKYGELNNPNLYIDEHIRRTIIGNLQSTFYRCVNSFMDEADYYRNYNKQLDKTVQALEATGEKPEAIDSLRAEIEANKKRITHNEQRTKDLLDFRQEKMPLDVIEMDPVLQLLCGNVYFRLGERETAMMYYDDANDRVGPILEYFKKIQSTWKYQDRYLSALELMTRYYGDAKEYSKASENAKLLFSISGKPQHQRMMEDYLKKVGTEPAVQDSTRP